MFFKREGNAWRFLTAGSAFPEDDLRGSVRHISHSQNASASDNALVLLIS
jgi:hypothetical protein